mgnify:FL=1
MEPALEIKNLRKVYNPSHLAVDDVSFSVAPGEFFGFLGPNGAGKSTTIHCITGIAAITSGTIKVFGYDVVEQYRDARKQIGPFFTLLTACGTPWLISGKPMPALACL